VTDTMAMSKSVSFLYQV